MNIKEQILAASRGSLVRLLLESEATLFSVSRSSQIPSRTIGWVWEKQSDEGYTGNPNEHIPTSYHGPEHAQIVISHYKDDFDGREPSDKQGLLGFSSEENTGIFHLSGVEEVSLDTVVDMNNIKIGDEVIFILKNKEAYCGYLWYESIEEYNQATDITITPRIMKLSGEDMFFSRFAPNQEYGPRNNYTEEEGRLTTTANALFGVNRKGELGGVPVEKIYKTGNFYPAEIRLKERKYRNWEKRMIKKLK